MEQLIPIINKLQDVFNAIGQNPIPLPQIVVIGSQSSGKSSVLEKLVGRDFLPRGTGIVTRRPLILQLYHIGNDSTEKVEEYGEFLHRPGTKYTDFSEIRQEIVRETERLTGSNKGISNKSINLKIFSPHVLNLTLVDLPGITKVPIGDQPADIEEQIRDMCLQFISNPNSIILAVTAANSDLANSDSLKMAKSIDTEGVRTIGVLTKLDLMDDGTDALEMLQGRVIPLKKGFVGIVNRSQADINNEFSIRDSAKKEMAFFQNHAAYRGISTRMGSAYLSKTLNTILMYHIKDCLPDIKSKINSMLAELDTEMEGMGDPTLSMCKTNLGATLLTLISRFASNFADSLEGRHRSSSGVEMTELYGGARINYIFNEVFAKSLQAMDPFDNLTDDDIRTAIRNANGPRQSLFVPEVSFEILSKRQIARLEQPGLQCVDLVFDELQRVTSQCETIELTRFADLRDRVVDVVNALLRSCLAPTQTMITNLIKIELSYINTSHPDFIGGSRAIAQLMDRLQEDKRNEDSDRAHARTTDAKQPYGKSAPAAAASVDSSSHSNPNAVEKTSSGNGLMSLIFPKGGNNGNTNEPKKTNGNGVVKLPHVPATMRQANDPTDRERIETEIIKSLLASYFDIVRKNFLDLVPKSIMAFLVNFSKENVQNHLVSNLYKENMLQELLRETDDIALRRDTCQEMRTLLQRAVGIVNEVRDFNSFK